MIGSFISRFLMLVLGYAYPACKCYKAVQLNKPEMEQLRFWCQYWILVAFLAIVERFADIFFSWLPLYCEAKLSFFLYLWYPNTRGATYVYDTYFGPYIAKHETEIDRNLLEIKAKAVDVVQSSLQTAASYIQTRFSEVLKYAIALVQAPKSRSFQTTLLQSQQPWEQQQASPQLSASPARQPARSRVPREETSAPADTTKITPQEQKRNMASNSLQPPAFPVQSRELVPETETDGSETANEVSKSEQPSQIETTNSLVVEDRNPQLLDESIQRQKICQKIVRINKSQLLLFTPCSFASSGKSLFCIIIPVYVCVYRLTIHLLPEGLLFECFVHN